MPELAVPMVRTLVMRYAKLLERLGDEIGERPLVLPNAKFFPDTFQGDEASLERLVRRMQRHAGMKDIPIRPVLIEPEADDGGRGTGCGSGACATPKLEAQGLSRVAEDGEAWLVRVAKGELRHPVMLTANVACALGSIFLMETLPDGEAIEEPIDISIELAAVALGFGELLLEGSHIYAKGCGGPQIARVTTLGPEELSLVTALFVAQGKHSARDLRAELPVTQREAFDEARALVDSNARLVELLARDSGRVARGDFKLSEATPWLTRLFKKRQPDGDLSLAELEAELEKSSRQRASRKTTEVDPERDELRALVDEALTSHRSSH